MGPKVDVAEDVAADAAAAAAAATAARTAINRRAARRRLEVVRVTLQQQLTEVDRLLAESTPDAESGPHQGPCRFCGNVIMSAATTCGFCWHKLEPAAVAAQA
jgi:hypothetical protein